MRTPKFFITGILCLLFSIQTLFAQNLNTRITLKVKDATLPQVLGQLQKKYGYRFSYLNNELPAKTRFSAEIKNKPLSEVLDVLLEKTDMGYKQSNGQIIIKKGFPKNKPKETTFQKLPAAEKPAESKAAQTARTTPNPEPEKNAVVKTESKPEAKKAELPVDNATDNLVKNTISSDEDLADSAFYATDPQEVGLLEKLRLIRFKNETDAMLSDSVLYRDYHIGFVPPISTNGTQATKYVNKVSAHLLMGTAAGLEGVEFSGFGNLEKSYVRGAQFAGFFNIVQNSNASASLMESRNEGFALNGGQFSGFMNLANGSARGGQFAGYMNVAAGNLNGGQFAGFLNIARNVKGVQAAGYMNLAKNADGAQLAGFLNVADTVSGFQGAGFVNLARCVKGTQLGFINIADSSSGVSIGLFNWVNKGGYKHAEIYAADDFDANITYKLGVAKFYTMLALGVELNDHKRYGYGIGFGREASVTKHFKLSTDLVCYQVIEESFENFPDGMFEDYDLNLLNKFRLLGGIQLSKHFTFIGGPVLNVAVSRYQAPGSEEVGSMLTGSRNFYNHTTDNGTNIRIGFGFNAGIRF
jgi:hypothetical protein